jgi:hypothetical protein
MKSGARIAERMLGLTEIEVKQRNGYPDRQFTDGGYTVLIYTRRLYTNLYQYGSIDKYQYTVYWFKNDICTNWYVGEDRIPPDDINFRLWGTIR